MLKQLILIGLGGGVGSIFRYLVSYWMLNKEKMAFPWPTFIVNILGCLLIGFFIGLSLKSNFKSDLRFLLIVGFCGGFTTFSTFSSENLLLWQNGNYAILFLYIFLSVILGVFAVVIGNYLANLL